MEIHKDISLRIFYFLSLISLTPPPPHPTKGEIYDNDFRSIINIHF
jgi:hypothetical protein